MREIVENYKKKTFAEQFLIFDKNHIIMKITCTGTQEVNYVIYWY